ncbi:MFS transporter [Micromonospora sp. NPDC049801]|uniref:MFS transporter n=1 Tax=unclassified Micromonospora TaxID=2617518 RepID=UPI003403C8B5
MSTTPSVADQVAATQPSGTRTAQVSHISGFWSVAVAFLTLMAFGTVPTPLWPLYQARDHFGATTVTVAFAVMVVGAAASFLALGHLSDRMGRRRIIAPALVVGIVAAVVLAASPSLTGLIIGRLLTGVAVGLMTATSTAYLSDLYRRAYPDRPASPTPALVASVANLGGLALGPVVAGALTQWVRGPLSTSYLVFAVAMTVLLFLVLLSPETVDRTMRTQDRPDRFRLRAGQRVAFGTAGVIGFFAFAVMGLFSSLGAIIVRGQLGITSQFVVGLALFASFGSSAVTQIALGRLSQRPLLVTGTVMFPAGLALTAVSLYHPALSLFFVAAILAGGGAGLLFKGAVTQTAIAAEPASRAGVLAVFFVIAYLGMGLPSIAFSVIIRHVPLAPTMIGFAIALSVGAAAAVIATSRAHGRRPGRANS